MAAPTAPKLRQALKRSSPSLDVERALWDDGHEVVVGVDEVGRGAWAGPLDARRRRHPPGQAGLQDP